MKVRLNLIQNCYLSGSELRDELNPPSLRSKSTWLGFPVLSYFERNVVKITMSIIYDQIKCTDGSITDKKN